MASTQSFSTVNSTLNYDTVLANVFQAYSRGIFTARRVESYYVELCAGVQVGNPFWTSQRPLAFVNIKSFANFLTFQLN